MALINCKECGGQVSTQAKACPSCGAKVKKPTSVVTWIFLGFVVFGVLAALFGSGGSTSENSVNETGNNEAKAPLGIQYEGKTTDPTARGMIILVKEKLTKDAINAESVQFKNVFYANQNNMTAICGEINIVKASRQSGFRRFISNGIADTAMEGHSKNFDKLWDKVCKH
ncbi:FmdB family zinc ribbon protein [Acinetobacter higginsii]|uniref:hypothetical protein n=1 Tax=Acinetobacter higginsii TaxID=70347 RepID=UPI001F4BB07E|nr:hypothetical protein [Acinetobacter higginsii]MCH7338182.1 hypothetical protein [Acinetobacter higginsii]